MTISPRQKIISKAAELLELQGYRATGLNQIVEESDTPRGSLYYYFPEGKEELVAEAVLHRAQVMQDHAREILNEFEDPVEAFYQLILDISRAAESCDCQHGSPLAMVALEASNSNETIREACREAYAGIRQALTDKLIGSDYAPDEANALAMITLSAVEGAGILSRTEKSAAPLETVAEQIKILLTCSSGD